MSAAGILCLAGYIFVYAADRANPPIRSDGFSYYVYLPSWFIFHDPSLSATARDCCAGAFPEYTAIIRWPGTRRWVNAHPIGVAIMQAPFFLAAHALTLWTNLAPDGFSFYYQHAAGLAGTFWVVAGLYVLRRLLQRHFDHATTTIALIVILFGTNLYHYATYDSSYSHPYSFFLFAAFMWLVERWHDESTTRTSVLVGICAGMIVLVRHTNVLFLLTLPLYSLYLSGDVGAWIRQRWRALATIAAAGVIVISPQLAMYYAATGRFLVSSYGSLGFHWSDPQLWGVTFSVTKGVFFWSPVLMLALAGLFFLRGRARAFLLPALVFFIVNTYLIASWWDWQFGGSYGHRGFVDMLPVFALGLGAFVTRISTNRLARAATLTIFAVAICLSTFQMLQYWYGIVPFSDMTWDHYARIFLRWR